MQNRRDQTCISHCIRVYSITLLYLRYASEFEYLCMNPYMYADMDSREGKQELRIDARDNSAPPGATNACTLIYSAASGRLAVTSAIKPSLYPPNHSRTLQYRGRLRVHGCSSAVCDGGRRN